MADNEVQHGKISSSYRERRMRKRSSKEGGGPGDGARLQKHGTVGARLVF